MDTLRVISATLPTRMEAADLEVSFSSPLTVHLRCAERTWTIPLADFEAAVRGEAVDGLLARPCDPAPVPRDPATSYPLAFEDLQVLGLLGRSRHSVVLRAWDRLTREAIALKLLHAPDPWAVQAFKNEFRRLADVCHPALVTPFELLHAGGRYALAMPWIHGRDVRAALAEAAGPAGPLADEPRVRRIVVDLLRALQALHDAGLVHLDLKPPNVLVDAGDRVHLLDFGLSRVRARQDPGGIAGTPLYMAPEQLRGAPPAPAMDLYALGVLLHEALSGGQTPFDEHGEDRVFGRLFAGPTGLAVHRPCVDPEWAELCDGLLAHDPSARPSPGALLARLSAAVLPPAPPRRRFLGRERELAALLGRWADVREGPPALAIVAGLPGMGKTELVRRFADAADAVVIWSRCHEHDQSPLKALDGALDPLVELLAVPEAARGVAADLPRLAASFPAVAALAAGPGAAACAELAVAPASPPIAELGDALARLFTAVAAGAPALLVLDDVQWGDADSADVLAALLASPAAQRLMVVVTRRDAEAPTSAFSRVLEARIARGVPFSVLRLNLGPLPDDLAAATLGDALGRSADDPLVRRRVALAAGAPFLLERYAQHPVAEADPPPLFALVAGQLERWPLATRRLVSAAALAAGATPLAVLARAAEVPLPGRSVLADLRAEGLLTLTGSGAGRSAAIRHELLRVALVEGLSVEARVALHRGLAGALAEAAADPGTVAFHLEACGDRAAVPAWALRGAEAAEHAAAFAHAAELLTLALDAGGPELPGRRQLQRRRADALRAAGLGERAADAYLELADAVAEGEGAALADAARSDAGADAGSLADGAGPLARALRREAAAACLTVGALERGLELLAPVLRELDLAPPAAGVRGVARVLGGLIPALLRGDVPGPSARVDPLAAERSDTCWTVATALVFVDPVAGLDMAFRALRYAAASGSRARLGRVTGFLAAVVLAQLPGARARAERWLDALAAWSEGEPSLAALAPLWASYCAHARGDLPAAVAQGLRALDALSGLPWATWERVQAASAVARALRVQGEYTACAELCRTHLVDAERRGDLYAQVLFGDYPALPQIARGDLAQARTRADWSEARWLPGRTTIQSIYWMIHRCYADLYEGDVAGAARRLVAARAAFRAAGGPSIVFLRVDHDLLEARLARVARPGADLRPVDVVLRRLARESPAEARGNAELLAAGLHGRAGDKDLAVAALDRALAAFEPAGIAMEAAAARLRRAELVGDDAAAELALAQMRRLGARDPQRWADLIAPGFP